MTARVHRSGDGTLYLTGGSNDVLGLFGAGGFDGAVDCAAWSDRLAAREALFARRGLPWRMLLAPEKLSVLGLATASALLGEPAVPPAEHIRLALPHPALLDPTAYLRAQHASGYRVYPATDSHWTSLGALCAFQWAMAAFGLQPDYAAYRDTAPVPLHYRGDLWEPGHADLPPELFERRSAPAWLERRWANELVAFKEARSLDNEARLHTGSAAHWHNPKAQFAQRLMLFGSSFSDHRAECSLLTFVAALFFRDVHFVWSTSLDIGLIDRTAPDLVLIEMPERFLPLCPEDDLELDSYAAARIAAFQADAAPLAQP
jgi:hypothetical protein